MFGGRRFELLAALCLCMLLPGLSAQMKTAGPEELSALLPLLEGWSFSEAPQFYLPETLFEYIDGAAESYLSYDFQRLAVGQSKKNGADDTLTAEVYDMGSARNAFGIYSAERYPESRFLRVGVQGYIEEGALNFFSGRYYIKLMGYECGDRTEAVLIEAARMVAAKITDPAGFPTALAAFPRQNLVANSEKFILKNFLGMSFLEAGYTAQYRAADGEFEGFIIDAGSADKAGALMKKFLSQAGQDQADRPVWNWKDRYLKNVFLAREGSYLIGLVRAPDGWEEKAPAYLSEMGDALKNRSK